MLKLKKVWPIFLILIVALLMVAPQMITRGLVLETDSLFHFNRIFDTYSQFKAHSINYFQMNYGYEQSGRIINALYGPYFAYFLGAVLFVSGSWVKFEIVSSFLLFFVAGLNMYFLAKKLKANTLYSLLAAILFMTSPFITAWQTSQQFTSWGVSVMPLVIYFGVYMISASKVKILGLAGSVSLIIQIHVFSAFLSIVVLFILFMLSMVLNKQRVQILKEVILAAVIAVFLTANVWGGMLDVFLRNKVFPPFPVLTMAARTTTFSLTQIPDVTLDFGPVMFVIAILTIALLFFAKTTRITKVLLAVGYTFLVISSKLLPWNDLAKSFPQLSTFLQFPVRLAAVFIVLVLPGLAVLLTELHIKSNGFRTLAVGLCTALMFSGVILEVSSAYMASSVWNSSVLMRRTTNLFLTRKASTTQIREAFSSNDLGEGLELLTKPSPDYLPAKEEITARNYVNVHPYGQYYTGVISKNANYKKTVKGQKLITSWKSGSKKAIQVPVIAYSGTEVVLNGKRLSGTNYRTNGIGCLEVQQRKGINTLITDYHAHWWAGVLIVVSAIATVLYASLIIGLWTMRLKQNLRAAY